MPAPDPAARPDPVAGYLRRFAGPDVTDLSDGALLGWYAAARDEAAFAELVRRHGPMTLAAAARVLGGREDAEDVAQAAFLILARRAGALAGHPSVAGWLHAAATRMALRVRSRRRRRPAVEARAARPEAVGHPPPDDLSPLIDSAVRALPSKLRDAVVLCELEGIPRPEAAARLGVPVGTLSSRLAAAHARLARRLARSAGTVAAALAAARSADGGAAAVALLFSPGRGVPAAVSALVLEVTRAMLFTKLKVAAACATLATGGIGATVGVARYASGDDPRPGSGPPAAAVKPADSLRPAAPPADTPAARVDRLKRERLEALRQYAEGVRRRASQERSGFDGSADRHALDAELDLAAGADARVRVREKMVESAKFWEALLRRQAEAGNVPKYEVARETAARLAAELELERERADAGQTPAAEPRSLLQTVAEWQYPGSALAGAQASDGQTIDAGGTRTVPSTIFKAGMTTDAPVEKVLDHYRGKLAPAAKAGGGKPEALDPAGRSVAFRDDSAGRPLALHTVVVNAGDTSTTLVISRGKGEAKTHIAWTQYRRFNQ